MTDFKLNELEGAQAVKGSHFQFKSEKEWRSSSVPLTNRFTLNMRTLAEDLSTIPFYEIQNLSKDLFSEEELKKMEKKAETCAKKINPNISEKETNIATVSEQLQEKLSVTKNLPSEAASTAEINKSKNPGEVKDYLEDWLDSVLDD